MGTPWYLVQCKTGRERFAEDGLARQGFDVFLPSERRTVRHARRTETVRRAFFPGYLFVSLDVTRGGWRPIDATPGVVRLVTFGARPAAAPSGWVDTLRASADARGEIVIEDEFACGDRLRVRRGPLSGLTARVAETARSDRIRIVLDAMTIAAPVELARTDCLKLA
ncbi:MAG: transcriptional activator RfaH [Pseudomonadota bacterium]